MTAAVLLRAEAPDSGRRVRPLGSRDDASDERPVERQLAVERRARSTRACEAPRDDDLRRRPAGVALREAGRIFEPGRRQIRMLLIDAVVDDRDPDAFALRAGRRGELRRPDDRRALVHRLRVRVARVHLVREGRREQLRELRVREADGEAVQEHAVVARDLRLRDQPVHARDRKLLLGLKLGHVRARERAVHVQPPHRACGQNALRGAAAARGGSSSVTITRVWTRAGVDTGRAGCSTCLSRGKRSSRSLS